MRNGSFCSFKEKILMSTKTTTKNLTTIAMTAMTASLKVQNVCRCSQRSISLVFGFRTTACSARASGKPTSANIVRGCTSAKATSVRPTKKKRNVEVKSATFVSKPKVSAHVYSRTLRGHFFIRGHFFRPETLF